VIFSWDVLVPLLGGFRILIEKNKGYNGIHLYFYTTIGIQWSLLCGYLTKPMPSNMFHAASYHPEALVKVHALVIQVL